MAQRHFAQPYSPQILLLQGDLWPAPNWPPARAADHTRPALPLSPPRPWRSLADGDYDGMVLDLDADDGDSVALLHELSRLQPDLPLVILTGSSLPTAIAAIQVGAADDTWSSRRGMMIEIDR